MLSANNASRRGGRHGKRAAGAGDLTTALDGPTALPLDELTEDLWRVTGTLLLAAHDRQEREDPDERREAEQTLRHARPEVERARAALADRLDNPEPQNDDDLDDELRSEARERLAHADHALAGLDAADYRAHWERHEVAYGRRVAAELRAADPRNGAVPELLSDPRRVHALAQLMDADETAYDELRDDLVSRGLPTAAVDEIGQAVRSKVDQLAAARRAGAAPRGLGARVRPRQPRARPLPHRRRRAARAGDARAGARRDPPGRRRRAARRRAGRLRGARRRQRPAGDLRPRRKADARPA